MRNSSGRGRAAAASPIWRQALIGVIASALLGLGASAQALTLTGIQLRKSHGAVTIDLPVDRTQFVDGAVTVEPRAIGAGHQVVFQFDGLITAPGTATAYDETGAIVGTATPAANGSEATVTLAGIADNKRVTVTLGNVNGTGLDVAAAVGFLLGDVNGTRDVSASDVSALKARAGQVTDLSNARFDLNASGAVTAADIAAVKARSGSSLPAAFTLGGTLSGLSGTLVLQNNGGGNFALSTNGRFTYPIAASGAYNITVLSQPTGHQCAVSSGSGMITGASVGNVSVACSQFFFSPALSYLNVNAAGQPSFPTALTVTVGPIAATPTFIPITSSNPASLTVVGGGVTIPAGQTSATVLLNGSSQSAGVTLTATRGANMLGAVVRVLGAAEQPLLTSMTPATTTITPGSSVTFTVNVDFPAPMGGTLVSLTLSPPGAGTIAPTILITAGQTSATFSYTDGGVSASTQVTATLGTSNADSTVTVAAFPGGFIINEIDYDQIGSDSAEFVELYNGGNAAINLADHSLVFVNGVNNIAYLTVPLGSGMLQPGQYLVVGSDSVLAGLPIGVIGVSLGATNDMIQNGAPDGIALVNTALGTVVDSFSYEGGITMAALGIIPGLHNLVKGTPLPAGTADSNSVVGSLCRFPNAASSNNDNVDWRFCNTPTPGATNLP